MSNWQQLERSAGLPDSNILFGKRDEADAWVEGDIS